MEKDITKKYSNGDVTVVWQPGLCIHSALCFHGLPGVFDPRKRPWVTLEGGKTDEIVAQVNKCPSGALTYYRNSEMTNPAVDIETIVEVSPNGPLLVYGNIKIKDAEGNETIKNKVTALCRCGQSANKPYCDGTHRKVGFEG
ncbi:MAG: (4Fe-4S)-binding protein [Sphingobacteriales bacterium JAD_PAG50586_3]|nr:MAG: (4Fe-4S)-binding protein [Sphingobacteriales bacterium JAD_PAG50586_3]